MYIKNHVNDVETGILDNDKNKDGIPDFILSINPIYLKIKTFKTEQDL